MRAVWGAFVIVGALAASTPPAEAAPELTITAQSQLWSPAGSQRVAHPETPAKFGTNDVVVYCFAVPGYGGVTVPATVARLSQRFVALNGNGREFFAGAAATWMDRRFTILDRPADREENRVLNAFIPAANALCGL